MRAIGLLFMAVVAWLGAGSLAVLSPRQEASAQDLPQAVREALVEYAGSAALTEVGSAMENGIRVYELEWFVDGREHEVRLTEHGELVELDEGVPADEVPAAVRAAAERSLGVPPTEYERRLVVVYEAEARVNDREVDVMLLPTGGPGSLAEDEAGDDTDEDDDDRD